MIRGLLLAFAVSVALALAARLIVRWRFGGKGRAVKRLRPHGGVEYAAFALVLAAVMAATLAQRLEHGAAFAWAAASALGALAAWGAALVFFTHVFWTVEGVGAWDPWRRQRFIRWEHVRAWSWSPWRRAWSVSDGAQTIGWSRWRNGADELEAFLIGRFGREARR
jgi:hypothetical protein